MNHVNLFRFTLQEINFPRWILSTWIFQVGSSPSSVFDVLEYTITDVTIPFSSIENNARPIKISKPVKLQSFDTKVGLMIFLEKWKGLHLLKFMC